MLAWHFPIIENYDPAAPPTPGPCGTGTANAGPRHGERSYLLGNLDTLRKRSLSYRDALHGSTLPPAVIDAVSSQASIMRTNTVMVGEGRSFASEGCADHEGSCPMNCTHVYNYEQSMAHLYPDLERSMRDLDFLMNMRPDGSMSFRTPVPPVPGGNKNHPAADGQMGCVLKVYREWQICGDVAWLRRLWPEVKRALEYAWLKWDADRDGVMEGEQHNTYDINFYGPNAMMGTLCLGALAAASRMAAHLGEDQTAPKYDRLRARSAATEQSPVEWRILRPESGRDQSRRAQIPVRRGCLRPVARPVVRRVAGLGGSCRGRTSAPLWHPCSSTISAADSRNSPTSNASSPPAMNQACCSAPAPRQPPGAAVRLLRRGLDRHRVSGGGAPHLRGLEEKAWLSWMPCDPL